MLVRILPLLGERAGVRADKTLSSLAGYSSIYIVLTPRYDGPDRNIALKHHTLFPAVKTAGIKHQTFAVVVFCIATCDPAPILGRCPLCHHRTITLAM
jgi:hypothetical protein